MLHNYDAKLRVKITEVRDFGYVTVKAKDEDAAMKAAEAAVREEYDLPGEYVALEDDAVEVLDWMPADE